jgi:hypothetical protein
MSWLDVVATGRAGDFDKALSVNLYYTGTPGALFEPGAGLGTPDLSKLAADFRSAG